jgi:hypothetical protein
MIRSLCIVVALVAPLSCLAQPSLVGTYKLLSNDLRLDGVPIRPMGQSQHGYLVITPKVVVQFFTADERKPGASPEAKIALFDSLSAWAGPYRRAASSRCVHTRWTESG